MDLVLVMVWSTLKSQKKRLNLEIWLSQEKNHQKVEIQLILTLRKPNQIF